VWYHSSKNVQNAASDRLTAALIASLDDSEWSCKMKIITKTWINLSLALSPLILLLPFLLVDCGTRKKTDAAEIGWPRWRGPNGNGISTETDWDPTAIAKGPKIVWIADIGSGYSNVAIRDNRIYTMGGKGRDNIFSCLNAETGKVIWRRSIKSDRIQEPHSTPTIEGEYIYALSEKGTLFCLKAKNGRVRWERDLVKEFQAEQIPSGYSGSPVVEGDLIVLNVNTAGLAINKNTGDKIWAGKAHTGRLDWGYHATPVLYERNGKRYALLFSGTGLFSVDPETGKQFWHYAWGRPDTANVVDPLVFDNKIFIASAYLVAQCALLDLSGDEPKEVWRNKNLETDISSSVYVDGYIYGCSGDQGGLLPFRCIDVKTGEVMWEKTMRMVTLIAAEGKLIILEEDGTLRVAEATPAAYREISSGKLLGNGRKPGKFWTPPVLYKGRIYCRDWFRSLFCVDVRKRGA
jgi:outer membrane protein assembly factor BamB